MDNPIRSLRMSVGLTQGDLIRFSGMNRMVVLRTEQGLYNAPSRKITDVLTQFIPTLTHDDILEMYVASQNFTRSSQGWWVKKIDIGTFPRAVAGTSQSIHPFIYFRNSAPSVFRSRMGFCKAFCVRPDSMRLFESGEQIVPPDALMVGLRLAGMSPAGLAWVGSSALEWAQGKEGVAGG